MHPLALAEGRLGPPSLVPLAGLGQGPPDGRREAVDPVLEHVVGRPLLEALDGDLLAHHPRDEQEGGVGSVVPGDLQSREAVEAGQGVIGQDQVVAAGLEGVEELGPAVDPVDLDVEPVLGQA